MLVATARLDQDACLFLSPSLAPARGAQPMGWPSVQSVSSGQGSPGSHCEPWSLSPGAWGRTGGCRRRDRRWGRRVQMAGQEVSESASWHTWIPALAKGGPVLPRPPEGWLLYQPHIPAGKSKPTRL